MSEQGADRSWNSWMLLLALPFLGLLFPQFYNREDPALFGMPFFYWYQFGWVLATTGILGIVYFKLKDR